jgi:predicted Zn-dependent protease with MMP-like domain
VRYKITHKELKKIVKDIIKGLPEPLKNRFKNIYIVVEEKPTVTQLKALKAKGITLYGLFEGIPYPNKSAGLLSSILPSKITIFKGEIRKMCKTKEQAVKVIKQTIYHEIGHYFGLGEKDLKKLGL